MLLAMDLADAGVKLWRQPNPPTPPRSIASLYSSLVIAPSFTFLKLGLVLSGFGRLQV